MPGLQGLAQFQFNAIDGKVADLGKTKLQVRGEPLGPQRVTCGVELDQHISEVLLDKVRQHEPVMQFGPPAGQALGRIRFTPETRDQGTQQQLLDQAHACMRRHLEGTQLKQT
ncbi:hypothetical protein D3C79_902410 [compost metagenome]